MITSKNPIVVPSIQAATFDTWWMSSLNVDADNPNQPIRVRAVFRLVRLDAATNQFVAYIDATGKPVEVVMDIPNLTDAAKNVPSVDIAAVINGIVTAAGDFGVALGVLS